MSIKEYLNLTQGASYGNVNQQAPLSNHQKVQSYGTHCVTVLEKDVEDECCCSCSFDRIFSVIQNIFSCQESSLNLAQPGGSSLLAKMLNESNQRNQENEFFIDIHGKKVDLSESN